MAGRREQDGALRRRRAAALQHAAPGPTEGSGAQIRLRLEQPARLLAGSRAGARCRRRRAAARPAAAGVPRRAAVGAAARPARRRRPASDASAHPGCAASSRSRCRARRPARDRSAPAGARARDRVPSTSVRSSTLCAPARRRRTAARRLRPARTSQATRRPRPCIAAASASDLAARARAQIEHLRPGLRLQQQRRDLRAFVLHLDPAAGGRLPAPRRRADRAGADPTGENGVGVASTPWRASERMACSRVAASVFTRRSSGAGSRRAASSRAELHAEERLELRQHPLGAFEAHAARLLRMLERAARERRQQCALRRPQPLWMPGRAAEDPRDTRRRPALEQQQRRESARARKRPRAGPLDPPVERGAAAQPALHALLDGMPLGARERARAAMERGEAPRRPAPRCGPAPRAGRARPARRAPSPRAGGRLTRSAP